MNAETAKFNMVEQQIRPWNVLDRRILDAIMDASREAFVAQHLRPMAYADMNLPIGCDQVMMQPVVEARLLQAMQPKATESALEIGTGSGYMASLLGSLTMNVQTVEIREQLAEIAQRNLEENGSANVEVAIGDGSEGWDAGFEPDCIVLSGSVPELPGGYRASLAVGGRLVAVVGREPIMSAVLVERIDESSWVSTPLFETCLPPLENVIDEAQFEF